MLSCWFVVSLMRAGGGGRGVRITKDEGGALRKNGRSEYRTSSRYHQEEASKA